jgi:hypothetical protein
MLVTSVHPMLVPLHQETPVRITIDSTDVLTEHNGKAVRVWKGTTEGGVACTVLVAAIAVEDRADNSQFERELRATEPPKEMRPLAQVLSLRSVL